MLRWHHFTCLAFAAGLSQTPVLAAAQEGESVTLRFLSIPHIEDSEPVRLKLGKGNWLEVETPTDSLSRTYEVKAQSDWKIVGEVEGEDGKSTVEILGTTPALDSSDQLILLVRKGETNADGFDVIAIDCGVETFGAGMLLFVNATEFEFGGNVGGHAFSMEPGKFAITEPKPESEGSKLCHGTLFYTKEDREKPFLSTKWPLSEKARGLVVVYQDPGTSRLRLHSVRDFL